LVFFLKETRIIINSCFFLIKTPKILEKMPYLRNDHLHSVGHLHPVYPIWCIFAPSRLYCLFKLYEKFMKRETKSCDALRFCSSLSKFVIQFFLFWISRKTRLLRCFLLFLNDFWITHVEKIYKIVVGLFGKLLITFQVCFMICLQNFLKFGTFSFLFWTRNIEGEIVPLPIFIYI
jgi:hypothetical protein